MEQQLFNNNYGDLAASEVSTTQRSGHLGLSEALRSPYNDLAFGLLCHAQPLARNADQFTVQLPPASTALYYTGAASILQTLPPLSPLLQNPVERNQKPGFL